MTQNNNCSVMSNNFCIEYICKHLSGYNVPCLRTQHSVWDETRTSDTLDKFNKLGITTETFILRYLVVYAYISCLGPIRGSRLIFLKKKHTLKTGPSYLHVHDMTSLRDNAAARTDYFAESSFAKTLTSFMTCIKSWQVWESFALI